MNLGEGSYPTWWPTGSDKLKIKCDKEKQRWDELDLIVYSRKTCEAALYCLPWFTLRRMRRTPVISLSVLRYLKVDYMLILDIHTSSTTVKLNLQFSRVNYYTQFQYDIYGSTDRVKFMVQYVNKPRTDSVGLITSGLLSWVMSIPIPYLLTFEVHVCPLQTIGILRCFTLSTSATICVRQQVQPQSSLSAKRVIPQVRPLD